uniref:Uncharacterized protein n=1 Tax=Romanomermis culicivorax TaxID=13658 RepID=A0A915JHS9_ROMCU
MFIYRNSSKSISNVTACWRSAPLIFTGGGRRYIGESIGTNAAPFLDYVTISKDGHFSVDIPVFDLPDGEKITLIKLRFDDFLGHCSQEEDQYTEVTIEDEKDQDLKVHLEQ